VIRSPAVAGRFYPADRSTLEQQVDSFLAPDDRSSATPPRAAIACLVPHAGYMYSGHVAGAVYARLNLPARFILIGPRHFPRGAQVAILSEGAWRTPLGDAPLDSSLASELRAACPLLREDSVAHASEHALEVQLPFLQRRAGDFRFVPIALGNVRYEDLEALGHAIAKVVAAASEPALLIASSDMNHYESDAITRVKDGHALDRILALDARGLFDVVQREKISMCGVNAAVSVIIAARDLGAANAELVRYATSADVSGDREEVVGYAGVLIR
jgi:AmmeMemoRadiSam system protein B